MPSHDTLDARAARLAQRQAAHLSRAQAHALGFSDSSIKRRLRSGRWERVHPGVYRLAGAPETWLGVTWAALLAAGPSANITHETAVRLSGSPHVGPVPVTLTVPHGGHHRIEGAVVHQIDDLRPHHVRAIQGLPASEPARAVVEVAATLPARRVGRVLDDLVFDRRTTLADVSTRLAEVARPGKPGVVPLARLLDERDERRVPAGSALEDALIAALVAGGLPMPEQQRSLPSTGAVEGVVDAAYPDCRLILEADGRRWHTRVRDLARDHARDAEAARVGWQTLRFLYEEITQDPDAVCATVRDVRAVRQSAPAPGTRRTTLAVRSGSPGTGVAPVTLRGTGRRSAPREAMGVGPDHSRP
jgi:hypothetical protein